MNSQIPNSLDEQIDRTLQALGATTPSPSLENRILQAIEEQASVPAGAEPHPFIHFCGKFPRSLRYAVAAAIFALFVYGRFHARPLHPVTQQAQIHSAPTVNIPGEKPLVAASAPLKMVSPSHSPGRFSLHLAAIAPRSGVGQTTPYELTRATLDQQALADFHSPSQPAPPLPPTSQERLVRLMLRRGESVELAKLDNARNPEIERAELTAFRNFFDPPAATQEDPAAEQKKPSPTDPDKVSQP